MDAEIPRDGGQKERFAALEARLHVLENQMAQMETQIRESLTVVYRAESLHARLLAKLAAAMRVLQQLVERLYRMVQQKRGNVDGSGGAGPTAAC
jgi:hypothetical protein